MSTINHIKGMSVEAFHGLAGDIINLIEPHTESDKNGLLIQLLAAVGNVIGTGVYYRVESTTHNLNLFVVIVGDTSKSRKGTSWNWINRIVKMTGTNAMLTACHPVKGLFTRSVIRMKKLTPLIDG